MGGAAGGSWGGVQEVPLEGTADVTDTVSSGGARPPGLRASVLELCMFSALCLASPRVLCGRLTLHWILLSYLAPQYGRSCGREAGWGERHQAQPAAPARLSGGRATAA